MIIINKIQIFNKRVNHSGKTTTQHIQFMLRRPNIHTYTQMHTHMHTQIASYSCPKQTSVKPLGRFSHTSNIKDSLQAYSVTLSVSPKLHDSCCFGYRGSLCFTWKHKPPRHHYQRFGPFNLCERRCNWFQPGVTDSCC